MNTLKETCGREIDLIKQQITFNGEVIQVRPKTFQLLMKFMESPNQLISKEELLGTVWDDIEVSDQVLFQTIRELRSLFDGEKVITTQPRKGYIWSASVCSVEQVKEAPKVSNINFYILTISIVVIIFLLAPSFLSYKPNNEKLNGSLVVLPVKSELQDNIHNWVYLGAMHQLISYFRSDDSLAVLKPEHVLRIMHEADIQKGYSQEQLLRIFDVSGATLIVESTLTGEVKDYQLRYSVFFREGMKRGVVFDRTVDGALEKLAHLLTEYTGRSTKNVGASFESDFSSELLVRAMEKRDSHEYKASNNLLAGLLVEDSTNVVAIRIMAMNHIALRNLDAASEHLKLAQELAEGTNHNDLPAIHYFKALIAFIHSDYKKSLQILDVTDDIARASNDWLYRAFASELKAKALMKMGDLDTAESEFKKAMNKYALIQCPVGKSQSLMSLSRVAKLAGNDSQAVEYLRQANQIIERRDLNFLRADLAFVRNKVI